MCLLLNLINCDCNKFKSNPNCISDLGLNESVSSATSGKMFFGPRSHSIITNHKSTKQRYESMVYAISGGTQNCYVISFNFHDKNRKLENLSQFKISDTNLYLLNLLKRILTKIIETKASHNSCIFADNSILNVNIAEYLRQQDIRVTVMFRMKSQSLKPEVTELLQKRKRNIKK